MYQVRICIDAGLAILECGGNLVNLSLATLGSAYGWGREMSGPSQPARLWRDDRAPGLDVETMTVHAIKILILHAIESPHTSVELNLSAA
jgi:hypothetical protein